MEASSDLFTATFLAASSRFVSRRACPQNVYSDNGTNFVGANKALQQDFKLFVSATVNRKSRLYAHQGITWNFIPPAAPYMGGLWEADVNSFNIHFKKVGNSMRFTIEELSTLLPRIESLVESRPIGPISESMEPLTPGHFLIGTPILAIAAPELTETPMSIVNRWQKIKAIHQTFCQRWKAEYLNELHK